MGRTRGYSSLGLDFQGMTWADTFVATNVCYDFAQIGFADNNYLIDRNSAR